MTITGVAGVAGTNASLMHYPYGLAFDSSNTLHIVDYRNHRVQKVISGTSMTTTVAGDTNGAPGNTMDRFDWPVDILFDASDNMFITDRQNDRVQLWRKDAISGITVAGMKEENQSMMRVAIVCFFLFPPQESMETILYHSIVRRLWFGVLIPILFSYLTL